jgi:hypothetical protein
MEKNYWENSGFFFFSLGKFWEKSKKVQSGGSDVRMITHEVLLNFCL